MGDAVLFYRDAFQNRHLVALDVDLKERWGDTEFRDEIVQVHCLDAQCAASASKAATSEPCHL